MKQETINVVFDNKKSTICCVNNQPCLFNHSVMTRTVADTILRHFSPVDSTKERSTMYLSEHEIRPQAVPVQPKPRLTYSQDRTAWLGRVCLPVK